MWSVVPETGLRDRYFLPMTTDVSKIASHMIALVLAGANHNTPADFDCLSSAQFCCRFTVWIYCGSSFLLCGGKFHFCCATAVTYIYIYIYMFNINYSVCLLRISSYIYACPSVFHATEKDDIAALVCVWFCYFTFHSVVEVKFLTYILNVTHRFVMLIISYANVLCFIYM
jgi:hypothetical protein